MNPDLRKGCVGTGVRDRVPKERRLSVQSRDLDRQLIVEAPLWRRVAKPLGWIAASLFWPPAGFAAASLLQLDGLGAMGLAVLPCLGVLAIAAPTVVEGLSARPLVLTWTDGGISVGAARPLPPDAFTVGVEARRRWDGRPRHVVTLSARAAVRAAVLRLGLLSESFHDEEEARALASAVQSFLSRS